MGAIEDTRKVIQDLVAPDLKEIRALIHGNEVASRLRDEALSAKIDALSDRVDTKIDALSDRVDTKIDALSDKMDAKIDKVDLKIERLADKTNFNFEMLSTKFEGLRSRIDANQIAILDALNIHKRLEVVEARTELVTKSQ